MKKMKTLSFQVSDITCFEIPKQQLGRIWYYSFINISWNSLLLFVVRKPDDNGQLEFEIKTKYKDKMGILKSKPSEWMTIL